METKGHHKPVEGYNRFASVLFPQSDNVGMGCLTRLSSESERSLPNHSRQRRMTFHDGTDLRRSTARGSNPWPKLFSANLTLALMVPGPAIHSVAASVGVWECIAWPEMPALERLFGPGPRCLRSAPRLLVPPPTHGNTPHARHWSIALICSRRCPLASSLLDIMPSRKALMAPHGCGSRMSSMSILGNGHLSAMPSLLLIWAGSTAPT